MTGFFHHARLVVVCIAMMLCALDGRAGERPVVTFLHACDVYNLSPLTEKGGVARFATLLQRERKKDPEALFVLPGDFLSPSLMTPLFRGAQMVEALDRLGLDFAAPGNHEFDSGLESLDRNIAASRFTWIVSNLLKDGALYPGMRHEGLRRVNGVSVGIFGLLDPVFNRVVRFPPGVVITDPFQAARDRVASLRAAGAELVVALTHMSLPVERELAKNVPGIDLILAGDDHVVVKELIGDTLLVEAGLEFQVLARIALAPGVPKSLDMVEIFDVDASVPVDPEMAAWVQTYESRLAKALDQDVVASVVPLEATNAAVRSRETNTGNLIADAMRAYCKSDLGLMNGGGIRTNRLQPAGAITKRLIQSWLPFGNTVVCLEIDGRSLREALEHGVSEAENIKGRFPQVSGMSFQFDLAAPVGRRVSGIRVGDVPLEDARVYTLATTDFLADGGDGYQVLQGLRRLVSATAGELITEVVAMHLIRLGRPFDGVPEGRIRLL
ncbi:MAG: 5'-nucleotidase C-terminal domain-containing protein [Magnetococcales bacterium]|nr:5'-nucleotidase C-terminal domain-containing protein [Magnetococcales bacterium]